MKQKKVKSRNFVAKALLSGRLGAGYHKKLKGKGSYDRKREKRKIYENV